MKTNLEMKIPSCLLVSSFNQPFIRIKKTVRKKFFSNTSENSQFLFFPPLIVYLKATELGFCNDFVCSQLSAAASPWALTIPTLPCLQK